MTSIRNTAKHRHARIYRHRLPVRIMHAVNALCFIILLMSGLGIFNAHPGLYWGVSSYTGRPPVLSITAEDGKGVLRILDHAFDTTGFLGVSTAPDGSTDTSAFPSWLTIPSAYSLAHSRLWHFFFAWVFMLNGVAYLIYGLWSRHLAKDLVPGPRELKQIGISVKDHLLFRHPQGEAARRYNVLQKLTYLAVVIVLLPLVILMGMAMSPMLNPVIPGWVDWFGGRQSARTLHFVAALLLVAFVAVHVFEVIVSGFWNHMRSMVTGYYVIRPDDTTGGRQ